MNTVFVKEITDREDALKYAYAFMKTTKLIMKECAFFNPNPKMFNSNYLMPRDLFSAIYKNDVPIWESFKTENKHIEALGFDCTACLDERDTNRVKLIMFDGIINFNCYGDYTKEVDNALEEMLHNYSVL